MKAHFPAYSCSGARALNLGQEVRVRLGNTQAALCWRANRRGPLMARSTSCCAASEIMRCHQASTSFSIRFIRSGSFMPCRQPADCQDVLSCLVHVAWAAGFDKPVVYQRANTACQRVGLPPACTSLMRRVDHRARARPSPISRVALAPLCRGADPLMGCMAAPVREGIGADARYNHSKGAHQRHHGNTCQQSRHPDPPAET